MQGKDCPCKNKLSSGCPCKNGPGSGCPYKNTRGKPKGGVHSYMFANVAIVDVIMTIIAAFIISAVFAIPFWKVLGVSFILGFVLHRFVLHANYSR